MEKIYNYVCNDIETMSLICGTNNENIIALEKALGNAIFPNANQLKYVCHSHDNIADFKNLCNLLVDAISQKIDIGPEFIASAYVQLSGKVLEDDTTINKDQLNSKNFSMIKIPVTDKKILPRTNGQNRVVQSLRNSELSFLIGPAGTGKTFLATAFALEQLLLKKKEKYIITRPVVEAGEKLGYLPGDLEQKILPYLRPIYDVLHDLGDEAVIRLLQEKKQIEVAPLAYMRGRTLTNSVVLLDEAQNCSPAQIKMFLTRLGEGSICIVNGDLQQSDLPGRNGLAYAVKIFEGNKDVSIVKLDEKDIQRSKIARIVIEAYSKYEKLHDK